MKRIIALVLVLVLLFSVSIVTGSALVSPKKPDYYYLTLNTRGSGTASANRYSVYKYGDDYFILTAADGDDPFGYWTIDGDYEIIDGDLYSRILSLKPYSDISATAVFGDGNNNNGKVSPGTGTPVVAAGIVFVVLLSGLFICLSVRKLRKKED